MQVTPTYLLGDIPAGDRVRRLLRVRPRNYRAEERRDARRADSGLQVVQGNPETIDRTAFAQRRRWSREPPASVRCPPLESPARRGTAPD